MFENLGKIGHGTLKFVTLSCDHNGLQILNENAWGGKN